jgi:hypothetical protein
MSQIWQKIDPNESPGTLKPASFRASPQANAWNASSLRAHLQKLGSFAGWHALQRTISCFFA